MKRSRSTWLFFASLLVLSLLLTFAPGCSNGGNNAVFGDDDESVDPLLDDDAGPGPDDDNDDSSPDDDDDGSPDDDDDGSPDDDDDNDDASPDDDDDDDDDDNDDNDDNNDNDDNDDNDDVTPGWPYIEINSPLNNEHFTTYVIDIDADVFEVANASDVSVYLDGVKINDVLTVTATKVTGSIVAATGGDHALKIEGVNAQGTGQRTVHFFIEKPWINVVTPRTGDLFISTTIQVDAQYGNCTSCTVNVSLDDLNINDYLFISNGQITGELEGLSEGEHTMVFYIEAAKGDFAQVTSYFEIMLEDPHFDLALSNYQVQVGDIVDVIYQFYDENGAPQTVPTTISASPSSGLVINDDTITCYAPGLYQITVSTEYGAFGTIEAKTWLFVNSSQAYTLTLSPDPDVLDVGGSTIVTTEVRDAENNIITWMPVGLAVDPPYGTIINGNIITFNQAGTVTIIGNVLGTDVYATTQVTVNPGDPTALDLFCDLPTVHVGGSVTCWVQITDEYGNVLPNEDYYYEVFPSATINGDTITFNGADGLYTITARSSNYPTTLLDSVVVEVIDDSVPGIVITAPDRALYMTSGVYVDLAGYVFNVDLLDPNTEVRLNGTPIFFNWETGDFGEQNIPILDGLNILTVEVEDGDGNIARASTSVLLATREWPNDSWVANAVGIHLSDRGFQQLGEIVQSYLDTLNLEEMIMAVNPVFDERAEVWGVTVASAKADVTSVEYNTPTIGFSPIDGGLTATAQEDFLRVNFSIRCGVFSKDGGDKVYFTIDGSVTVTDMTLTSNVALSVDPATHQVIATMSPFDLTFGTFDFYLAGFPEILVDLFQSTIESLLENAVEDALDSAVQPLVQDFMNDLPLAYNFTINNPTSGQDVNFSFVGRPDTVTQTTDGMTAWMEGQVLTSVVNPLVRPFNGSFSTYGNVPSIFTQPNGNPFGLALAIDDDLLNQIFYQVFRSGLLHQDFTEAIDACDTIFYALLPDICDTYQVGSDPVWLNVKIRPQLPPIARLYVPPKASDVGADIQIGDMFIYATVDGGSGEETVLALAVSTEIPAEFATIYPGNTLSMTLGTPVTYIDTLDNPLNLPENLFEGVGPLLVQLLIPILEQAIDDFQLPEFDVAGDIYQPLLTNLGLIGLINDYIGAFGDIFYVPK